MKKLFLIPLILLLAASLVLGSCGETTTTTTPAATTTTTATQPTTPTSSTTTTRTTTTAAPAGPTGTLRLSIAAFANESFDPIVLAYSFDALIYDPVVTYDPQGEPIPALAESWTLSPDGKTWTFKIRKGIKFHNGDALTSADFMFSLERFMSTESTNPWSPTFRRTFESMEAPDDYTWVLHTLAPEPFLTTALAAFQIVPKNYIEKNGVDYFRKNPIGTASWRFVKFTSGVSLELEAVKDHWYRTPAFEKLVIELVPEETTRIAKLKRGETDIIPVSIDRAIDLRDQAFVLQPLALPNMLVVTFPGTWLTDGPTSDIRVRQALSLSIKRQEIIDTYFRGFGTPGGGFFMSPVTWGWDPAWQADPYDPDEAKRLLEEAGYPDKFQNPVITVYATTVSWIPDFMQLLAGYWDAVGIKVQLVPIDNAKLNSMVLVRGSEGVLGTIVPALTPAAQNNVYQSNNLLTSKGVRTTGNDPKLDDLFARMTVELDPDKRKELYRELQEYGWSLYITFGTVQVFDQLAVSPEVGEFSADLYIELYRSLAAVQHKQ
jgi:peptide/nickel transport system substrate-binding protein